MQVSGKTVIVTGGASGIGRALCEAAHRSGAKKIIVADLNLQAAEHVARALNGSAFRCDVAQEASVETLIERTELEFGPIDGKEYADKRGRARARVAGLARAKLAGMAKAKLAGLATSTRQAVAASDNPGTMKRAAR